MALTSGFFNSLNGDRKYNAEDIASMFDGIITDGIIKNHGEAFNVTANGGNQVKIGSGRAWYKRTWTNNDSSMLVNLEPADSSLNRIDAVVLEINKSDDVRNNSIKVIKGTPGANPSRPALTNSIDISQLPLAYILRPASSTEVSQANITNMIGSNECPYASPIIDEVKLTETYGELTDSISAAQNTANTAKQMIATHNSNIGYLEGTWVADEGSGTYPFISYPAGFTKDNCVISTFMWSYPDDVDGDYMWSYMQLPNGSCSLFRIALYEEGIKFHADNGKSLNYRIVLLKVK